ncbi:MAG: Stage II sporulation protein M [uncultured Quadrisphaera sp.]|uniref:Stage II sporulation protein M n=1 Tax=uncultured Quadrisphaera sp. TaxID=904978 RepID=A0A6J4PFQ2_9ACTN|nr:MAG: Stage II sporulation protein M [uncultured Quadrisphaera sp.]
MASPGSTDAEALAAVHGPEWDELDELLRRRHLSGAQADRLVLLYRRTAAHLSQARTAAPDPVLLGRLSALVARARTRLTGAREPAWRDVARFAVVALPAALWRLRWWTAAVAAAFLAVAVATAAWVASDPEVLAALGTTEELRAYVDEDFAGYYRQGSAGSFAALVWSNNAWIAAQCVAFGISGVWVPFVVLQNAVAVGSAAGVMIAFDRGGQFFALVLPHGMLELTAVFVAAAAGLKVFWAWVEPGPRPRGRAVAEEGRALVTVALGLVVVLALAGLVEAVVTPSGLPTPVRIGVGALALGAFLAYGGVLGRRAVAAGAAGDVRAEQRGDVQPVAG